ncbi:tryptophan halogenase [Sphingomonas spermidinifaciens]|uniref:Tryptophan halogenase n=1 Tax=Sphingomonas spermidinifaciens TaxID=1141889 RepID=A0A2A4B436_9SPHN|nr:tryptophan halogenase family protein [Sphingomonas spermidinifaciens]PCD02426.1 tryptophan halogenase [Sphingomonas spermidinifaciens]
MSGGAGPIRDVVIVGGGTAGWMIAAAAARFLDDGQRRITLIESDAIGTVGVGEATIPPILNFNALLGIDEAEFVAVTRASFKLGIEFVGWGRAEDRYIHPFGTYGRDIHGVAFHQLWRKFAGRPGVGRIDDYAMSIAAARAGRFAHPAADPRDPRSQLAYAYHFDAGLYAAFLRRRAEAGGVARIEGRIAGVDRDAASGNVLAVTLDDGRRVEGELWIDCSGFRSLLLGETMGVPFVDWSHWLPCDRAWAVPCVRVDPLLPYTRSTARPAGWQWRIPLQHRTGNGHVFSSAFMTEEAALDLLLTNLDTAPTAEPRLLRFTAGRRTDPWRGNVVALGLAAGFLEPLESTSIHLVQHGIQLLFALFPDRSFAGIERAEYNRLMTAQFDAIRDFVILHYHATQRTGSPFWDHVRTMPIPDTLAAKIALFREKGRVFRYDDELFAVPNWTAVMLGQGIVPRGHDPVADSLDDARILAMMASHRRACAAAAAAMPDHDAFIDRLIGSSRGVSAGG